MRVIKTGLMSSVAHAIANDVGAESVVARTSVKANASQMAAKAQAFADKLADDEDATQAVERYLNAKIDVALGPQWFYLMLKDTYTAEELAATPYPGTKMATKDEATGVVTRHNNPDEYDAPKADGSIGTVSRYWSWDVADALPAGKAIAAELARAKAIAETNDVEAERIVRNANKRLQNLRGLVQRGIATWHQIAAIDGYENVTFSWDKERVPVYEMEGDEIKTDKDGNFIQKMVKSKKAGGAMVPEFSWELCRTESPVIIENAEKDEEGKVTPKRKAMSIVQFLSLDTERALAKGGSYDDLLATMRREQEDNPDASIPMIGKVAEFNDFAMAIGNYLDNETNYNFVKNVVSKKSEGNDKMLQTLDDLQKLLAGLVAGAPNARDRITAIKMVA